jgi:hypothetical protein
MKTTYRLLFFVCALLALNACVDPDDMLTVIQPDGSCYREFSNTTGTDFMLGNNSSEQKYFPVVLDSTWEVTWKLEDSSRVHTDFPLSKAALESIAASMPLEKNQKSNKLERKKPVFEVRIRRHFTSVEDMAAQFRLNPSHEWSKMKVGYKLNKQFRWFYTDFEYEETYPRIETNFKTPIDSFMSKDEATFWFTGEPNIYKGMNGVEIREAIGSLEDKYNHWFAKNLWDNEFEVLLVNYGLMKPAPVSKDSLAKTRDVLFEKYVKDDKDFKMEDLLNKHFKTKAFSIYWASNESPLKKFEKSFEDQEFIAFFGKAFDYKLCMPGRVVVPDNVVANGDTLSWKLTAYRMLYSDYVIRAHSRRANGWAFVVSGLVLLAAVGSFWYRPKKS